MAYERDDRRYGRDQAGYRSGADQQQQRNFDRGGSQPGSGYDRDHDRGYERAGGYRADPRSGYVRQPQGYDPQDRGFFDRAGDELRSWFGDEEAERRRRYDERYDERDDQRDRGREASYRGSDGDYGLGIPPTGGGRSYGGGSTGPSGFGGNGPSGFGGGGRVGGDYGAGRGAGATSAWGLGAGNDRDQWGHDSHYRSWRDRQIETFDRDYDEYRREHQSKFENDFSSWRGGRQTQREALNRVQEHHEVVGADGVHVGTVDKVRGDTIILTKTDPDAGGHHHAIPSAWLDTVTDKVTLRRTAAEAQTHWKDEERATPFGGTADRSGERSPEAPRTTATRTVSGN